MELLKLPSEVISNQILPYFSYNDLLRFRRVSHLAKEFADDFIRLFRQSNRFVRLNTGPNQNLSAFLKAAPSSLSKFQICINNHKVFGTGAMDEFLHLYGEEITHLQINFLEIPIVSRRVQRFFQSLTSLRSLSIAEVFDRNFRRKSITAKQITAPVPQILKSLTKLRIENYMCSDTPSSRNLVWEFITECSSKLQHLQHPSMEYHLTGTDSDPFSRVLPLISGNSLEVYDLNGFNETNIGQSFYNLVTKCEAHCVKLLNVHVDLIEQLLGLPVWDMEEHAKKLSSVVHSVIGVSLGSVQLKLSNLEGISIPSTVACSLPHWKFESPSWPVLRQLDILIDSEYLSTADDAPRDVKTNELLGFLFAGGKRDMLEYLSIRFSPYYAYRYPDDILPCPKIMNFCGSCPNIKILTLSAWIGTNRAISKIWSGLSFLEEVTFQGCTRIGDKAFIGKSKGAPSLLQAKRLKILRLERVSDMPKITNVLFTSVIRYMPLKEFYIGDGYIKSISREVIDALLDGVFAETIEKFPLTNVSLPNTTPEQVEALSRKFRCADMM